MFFIYFIFNALEQFIFLMLKILIFNFSLKCYFFKKDFIYLVLDRGDGREKERERNISVWLPLSCPLLGTWAATQACALTGNWTRNPLICRLALSPLSLTSQSMDSFFLVVVLIGCFFASLCYKSLLWFSALSTLLLLTCGFLFHLVQGCRTHFHRVPHQPHGCLQSAKCNFRTV